MSTSNEVFITFLGRHFHSLITEDRSFHTIHAIIESSCCMPEANVMFYVNYISIKINKTGIAHTHTHTHKQHFKKKKLVDTRK